MSQIPPGSHESDTQRNAYHGLPDDGPPEHERCACWFHEGRRIGWTEDDFCPVHPDDRVPERQVWDD